ncbi:MAG TPA: DUF1353 domain-containing protein [Actinomycetota bacterium]|jgi:hypothetical protein
MPFRLDSTVDVQQIDDREWRLLSELRYEGNTQAFIVPVGTTTDFASVPRAFVWFLPRYGRYTKAAILHDHLWRVAVPAGELSLPDADGLFRRAMRELEVPFLRRWLMWAAVRIGALAKPGGTRAWLRQSWQVFPLLLFALPLVVLPGALIVVALGLLFVVEWVVYLPLRLNRRIQQRRGRSTKAVNTPSLDLETT